MFDHGYLSQIPSDPMDRQDSQVDLNHRRSKTLPLRLPQSQMLFQFDGLSVNHQFHDHLLHGDPKYNKTRQFLGSQKYSDSFLIDLLLSKQYRDRSCY